MSDFEGKGILFLQLVVLFKMEKKRRKIEIWLEEYFVNEKKKEHSTG